MSNGDSKTPTEARKPTLPWIHQDSLFLPELLQVWNLDLAILQATSTPAALHALQARTTHAITRWPNR